MHSDSDTDTEIELHSNSREYNYNLRANSRIMAQTFDIKYLNVIPEFDGNPANLTSFISVCDDLLNTFWNAVNVDHINNKLLIHGITGKITGRARTILFCNSNAQSWDNDIKPILKQHFGDNRDLPSLNNNLTNVRHRPKETGLQFLDRIQEILLHICNYIDLNVTANLREAQKTLFRDIALRVFLTYLNEPLGSRIRARNPKNLSEASSIMLQEENILYLQKSINHNISHNQPQFTQNSRQNTSNVLPANMPMQQTFYSPRPSLPNFRSPNFAPQGFPSQPIQLQQRQVRQHFPTNRQVFGAPAQQNVFKPNSPQAIANAKSNKPTPMSVNTRMSSQPQFRPNQNYFQRTGPPNFSFQELHNSELTTNDDFPSHSEYESQDYNNYCEEPTFQQYPTYEPLINYPEDEITDQDHFLEITASENVNN